MKPFNLLEAKAGKPLVTRDGKKVLELRVFNTDVERPLIAVIEKKIFAFDLNGKFNPSQDTGSDLFMALEKKSIWVNVYNDGDSLCLSKVKFDTQEECLRNITRKSQYIKTIEITND
jgi:hypothetical protein